MIGATDGDRPCFVLAARFAADGAPPIERRLGRYLTGAGIAAVRAALADAPPPGRHAPSRIGVYTATGPSRYDLATLGRKMALLDGSGPLWAGGLADLDPLALLKLMSCNVLSVLGMALPARGPSEHFCDDALGGLAALVAARDAVATGAVDHAVVAAFDDLDGDHARAELAASDREGERRQLAVIHLDASPEGAIGELGAIGVRYHDEPGPVGGAAALSVVVEALADLREPIHLTVDVDRAFATVELRRPQPRPEVNTP